MGDDDEGGAALGVGAEHQIHDRRAGRLVEIAGRLVGDESEGSGRGRGDGDALLLAAGEFLRPVVQAMAEPDRRELVLGAGEGMGSPASSSGTATFSSAVMVGIRWKDWNTMPTRRRRKRASASSLSPAERRAGDADGAAVGPVRGRPSPSGASICRTRTFP